MNITVLAQLSMALGECPRWSDIEQAWYWVDITGRTLYRYSLASARLEQQCFGFEPACFAFTHQHEIILSSSDGIHRLESFGAEPLKIADPEAGQTGQRFNDGTVLPNGDLIVGSIGDGETPTGIRYRFRWNGQQLDSQTLESGYTIINAQCCSPDGQWCYVADTPTQQIHRQRIQPNGELAVKERFYTCQPGEYPDGAATDIDGNLWVAMYGSQQIAVIDPDGRKIRSLPLPAQQPTMVAFGGVDGRQLLVTTARQGLPESAARANGSVLLMETDTQGAPVHRCGH